MNPCRCGYLDHYIGRSRPPMRTGAAEMRIVKVKPNKNHNYGLIVTKGSPGSRRDRCYFVIK